MVSATIRGSARSSTVTNQAHQTSWISTKALVMGLALVTTVLTVDALIQPTAPGDLWLLKTVQELNAPGLPAAISLIERLTSSSGAVLAWFVVLAAFAATRMWAAMLATLALPAGGAVNQIMGEYVVGRSRPESADGVSRTLGEIDAASFPSGHVMGAVMLYGLLFFVASRLNNRLLGLTLQVFSILALTTVGFARVWEGAHWPSDVIAAYTLGGLILAGILAFYQRVDAAVAGVPFIRAAVVPHDEARPHAHALTSTVFFNGATVTKVYAPGFVPRVIYWLAFQAEFPYIRNRRALEAAVERRNLAARLTEYWFGSSRVAEANQVDVVGGQLGLTGEFIDGREPRDRATAKVFLRELRDRFEEAGLPTWQIDPRQPRAIDNVLETADGRYVIVDLESGLVSPLASLRTWWRAVRRGLVPLYDDVFIDVTRGYLASEERSMRAAMGDAWFVDLAARVERVDESTRVWHAGELRLWGKLIGGIWSGYHVRTWRSRAQARLVAGQAKATGWLEEAVTVWQREGRIDGREAAELREQINGPTFQAVLPHLGAHLAITVVLRFPFGSIARMAWTGYLFGAATGRLLRRRIDRRQWRELAGIHSPLVFLLAAIPGFGAFAYLAAKPVRSNRLLVRVSLDAVLRKVPWRLYQRSGLRFLIVRPPRWRAEAAETAALVPLTLWREVEPTAAQAPSDRRSGAVPEAAAPCWD